MFLQNKVFDSLLGFLNILYRFKIKNILMNSVESDFRVTEEKII